MKDRIPGKPGRFSAVISSEDKVKMENGEPFHITMTRDDAPIVPGTPFSKATVLPDELVEMLEIDLEDPVLADALKVLHARRLADADYPGCYYRMVDGEKEWLNPPMMEGVEYRTTERHNGLPVYAKLVITGVPANGNELSIDDVYSADYQTVDISATYRKVVDTYMFFYKLPHLNDETGESLLWLHVNNWRASLFPERYGTQLVVRSSASFSGAGVGSTIECVLKYTKG